MLEKKEGGERRRESLSIKRNQMSHHPLSHHWRCRCAVNPVQFKTGPVIAAEFCHCTICVDMNKYIQGVQEFREGGSGEENPKADKGDPFAPMAFVRSESLVFTSAPEVTAEKLGRCELEKIGGKIPRYFCKACGTKLFGGGASMGMCAIYFTPVMANQLVKKLKIGNQGREAAACDEDGNTGGDCGDCDDMDAVNSEALAASGMMALPPVDLVDEESFFLNCIQDVKETTNINIAQSHPKSLPDWRTQFPEEKCPHIFMRSSSLTVTQREVLRTMGFRLEDKLGPPPNGQFLRRYLAAKMCGCLFNYQPKGLPDGL